MSLIASGGRYPAFKFSKIGDEVKGTIVEFEDVQQTDFKTRQPKWWDDAKTQPQMQTYIVLETQPGNAQSRVSVYAKGNLLKALRIAVRGAGGADLENFAELKVKRIADQPPKGNGEPAKDFEATYERPFDPTAAVAA